jgi:hypothetical protein
MNPFGNTPPRTRGRFRVGDRVRIVVGYAGAQAEILEDHGPLGPGGQRFYTVLMKMPWDEEFVIDYPEDEMEPLAPAKGNGEAAP